MPSDFLNLSDLQQLGEKSIREPLPAYMEELLSLSLLEDQLSKKLATLRRNSSGLIPDTRHRVALGKAISSIRKAAKELQK